LRVSRLTRMGPASQYTLSHLCVFFSWWPRPSNEASLVRLCAADGLGCKCSIFSILGNYFLLSEGIIYNGRCLVMGTRAIINIMNSFIRIFSLAFTIGVATQASANDDIEQLKQSLTKQLPQYEASHIEATPIEGLYQVIIGGQVIYMTKDARYMIDGNLVDLSTKKNYSEDAMSVIRLSQIDQLGEEKMVVYTPKTVRHTITVVTDIDCPYCRRLHSEMDQYLDGGIKVRYIFMPLKGQGDYKTTVTVWCSKDQNQALDMAKAGTPLDAKECDNPIDEHLKVARNLGIRGTPAIILQDGSMLPGYVPAKKLVVELNKLNLSTARTDN